MEQAVAAYKNVVRSKRFKDAERRRERARLDEFAALHNARNEGRAEGITEGITQGITQGKAEIVRNMHEAGLRVAEIVKVSKITETEVENILKA